MPSVIAANRVEELPSAAVVPGSRKVSCSLCGHQVWASPGSLQALTDPDASIYCLFQCFPVRLAEERRKPDFDHVEYSGTPGWEQEALSAGLTPETLTDIKAFLIELNEDNRAD